MAKKHKHRRKKQLKQLEQQIQHDLSIVREEAPPVPPVQHTFHAPTSLPDDLIFSRWIDALSPTETPFLTSFGWPRPWWLRPQHSAVVTPAPLTEQDADNAVAEWERMLQEFNDR